MRKRLFKTVLVDGNNDDWDHALNRVTSEDQTTKVALHNLDLSQINYGPWLLAHPQKVWHSIEICDCSHMIAGLGQLLSMKMERLHILSSRTTLDRNLGELLERGLVESPVLKYMSLAHLQWTTLGMKALSRGLARTNKLRELNLSYTIFAGEDVDIIVQSLASGLEQNTSLRCLRLNTCRLQDRHVAALGQALVAHGHIRQLYLGGNSCHFDGMTALAALLEQVNLETLGLSHQRQESFIGEENASDKASSDYRPPIFIMANALPYSNLEVLHLASNNLRDDDIDQLAEFFQDSWLKLLDLNNNQIGDRGVSILTLHFPPQLKKLWLSDNPITPVGANALLNKLATTHDELTDLRIPTYSGYRINNTMMDLQSQLNFYGRLNYGGRKLLKKSNLPRGLWSAVLERVNRLEWKRDATDVEIARVQILYCLLHGPVLFER